MPVFLFVKLAFAELTVRDIRGLINTNERTEIVASCIFINNMV